MDMDFLEDYYNDFVASQVIMGQQNTSGESDVMTDEMDGGNTSEEEENIMIDERSSSEDHGNNQGENHDGEGSEEEAVELEHDGNIPQPTRSSRKLEPHIGMEFATADEAYDHYNAYAKELGFSVRKFRVERSRVDKRILMRSFVCSRQGEKRTTDKRRKTLDYIPRAAKKTKCGAVLWIKHKEGKWMVDLFVKEHNHTLVEPKESYLLRSHQKTNRATLKLIQSLYRAGIKQAKIMTVLRELAGGEEHVGITSDRCNNLFRAARKKLMGVDLNSALQYLQGKRESDPRFYFALRVDDDECLTGIFWVDGRARDQYKMFGDVVVFDTTYKKNNYNFPVAPFTGVNHHMQSTLFGCGLLADETKDSFIWLLKTWLHAMENNPPKAILTDEDPSMMGAIKDALPSTVHRLCAWHLQKHRCIHLGNLEKSHPGISAAHWRCVNESNTPTEFEDRWDNMIRTYEVGGNTWLDRQYRMRHHWVPCYFSDIFFADMTTTQRGESMNNYFKDFFSQYTPIEQFITQYEKAVKGRRLKEEMEDVRCTTTRPRTSTAHPIEKQAADVYTTNVFKAFLKEWDPCLGLVAREINGEFPMRSYRVSLSAGDMEVDIHYVDDNRAAAITKCTCKLFEKKGLLCRHIFKIYVITNREGIPPHYILPRWTKTARYHSIGVSGPAEGSSPETAQQPLWILADGARRLVTEGSLTPQRYEIALRFITDGTKEVLRFPAPAGPSTLNLSVQPSSCIPMNQHCPRAYAPRHRASTRGRLRQSRLRSSFENHNNVRRRNHCSVCNGTDHNAARCRRVNVPIPESNTQPDSQRCLLDHTGRRRNHCSICNATDHNAARCHRVNVPIPESNTQPDSQRSLLDLNAPPFQ